MQISRLFAATVMAALLSFPPVAHGLTISGYDADANERFVSGFPGTPVANTDASFLGLSYDFSGIGWRDLNPASAVTLISPQHFVTAGHVAPGIGHSVSFFNQAGVVKSYTVSGISTVTYNGQSSDLVVGTLSAAIPAGDLVGFFPVLNLGALGNYTGLSVLVYGQGGRVGTNSIDGFAEADFLPLPAGNGQIDSLFQVIALDGGAYEAQAQGGDSGSPTFAVWSGQLALVGVHSAINGTPPPDQTYDSFIPPFIAQIDAFMQPAGFAVTAVPEPSLLSTVAGVLAGCVVALRRRRRAA